jgi:site-specific DNA-methyltransferase (adenine-specific)
MKTLPDKSVDCFICDLPYGQLDKSRPSNPEESNHLHYSGKGEKGCAWDVKIDLAKFWEQVERLTKNDHVPIIHFCNTKFGIDLINSKPSWFRYDLVWNKERGVSFLLANKMPMKSHEMIYIFSKKAAYYNRIDIKGDFKPYKAIDNESTTRVVKVGSGRLQTDGNDGTSRCALSVINVRKPNTKGHPTEKPLALYHWLIERYCPKDGTVLDPTAGSFNSVEAAHDIGRHGIGIEMDEGFYKIAKERLQPEATNEFIPPASE